MSRGSIVTGLGTLTPAAGKWLPGGAQPAVQGGEIEVLRE